VAMAKKKTKKRIRSASKKVVRKTAKKISRNRVKKRKISSGLATLALILNVIFPGIGSLIGGKTKTGIFQIILMVSVIFFFPVLIGTIVWIAAVIWGIVTGVQLIQNAN
jgi:TM2 domain-containing membrane protein YozV